MTQHEKSIQIELARITALLRAAQATKNRNRKRYLTQRKVDLINELDAIRARQHPNVQTLIQQPLFVDDLVEKLQTIDMRQ